MRRTRGAETGEEQASPTAVAEVTASGPAGRAILHVSLGRGAFARQDIEGYLDWAESARPGLSFLVGDRLHMYSYAVLHRVELLEACRRVEAVGQQIETAILAAAAERERRAETLRWRDLERADVYWSLLACADSLYHELPAFQAEVRRELWRQLGEKLRSIGLTPETGPEDERLTLMDRAVLHEIAGLITLAEHRGYPVLVDRDPDLTILTRIYRGDFPELGRFLGQPALRHFLSLPAEAQAEAVGPD